MAGHFQPQSPQWGSDMLVLGRKVLARSSSSSVSSKRSPDVDLSAHLWLSPSTQLSTSCSCIVQPEQSALTDVSSWVPNWGFYFASPRPFTAFWFFPSERPRWSRPVSRQWPALSPATLTNRLSPYSAVSLPSGWKSILWSTVHFLYWALYCSRRERFSEFHLVSLATIWTLRGNQPHCHLYLYVVDLPTWGADRWLRLPLGLPLLTNL